MLDRLFMAENGFYRLWCSLLKVHLYCLLLWFYYYLLHWPQTFPTLKVKRFSLFFCLFEIVLFRFFDIAKIWQVLHNDSFWKLAYSFFVLNGRHYWFILSIFLLDEVFRWLADFFLIIVEHEDCLLFFWRCWGLGFH
jgi:hypothetical protein